MKQSLVFLISFIFVSCLQKHELNFQNCYSGKVEVICQFDGLDLDLVDSLKVYENEFRLLLDYAETKPIMNISHQQLSKGMPFKKLIVIRKGDTLIVNQFDEIESMMDLDLIGEVGCCPYTLCLNP